MGAGQISQPLHQPPLVSHPVELEQHDEREGRDAYTFSNPTFESYLDPGSDDELQLVEGCTTPRSAIKQQASLSAIQILACQCVTVPGPGHMPRYGRRCCKGTEGTTHRC